MSFYLSNRAINANHAAGTSDCSIAALMPKTSARIVIKAKANPIAIPIRVWLPNRAIATKLAVVFPVRMVRPSHLESIT
jgi:hypothetical protein